MIFIEDFRKKDINFYRFDIKKHMYSKFNILNSEYDSHNSFCDFHVNIIKKVSYYGYLEMLSTYSFNIESTPYY